MKHVMLLTLLLLFCYNNVSSTVNTITRYTFDEAIIDTESMIDDNLDMLYKAVRFMESANGTILVSKQSIIDNSQGELQIRIAMIDYCNDYMNCNYTYDDRNNPIKAKEIFYKIQRRFNKHGDIALGLHIWNAGQSRIQQRWHLTTNYRTKAFTFINSLLT